VQPTLPSPHHQPLQKHLISPAFEPKNPRRRHKRSLELPSFTCLSEETNYWGQRVAIDPAALLPGAPHPQQRRRVHRQGKTEAFLRSCGQEDLNLKENENQWRDAELLSTESEFSPPDAPAEMPGGAHGPYPLS